MFEHLLVIVYVFVVPVAGSNFDFVSLDWQQASFPSVEQWSLHVPASPEQKHDLLVPSAHVTVTVRSHPRPWKHPSRGAGTVERTPPFMHTIGLKNLMVSPVVILSALPTKSYRALERSIGRTITVPGT